MTGSDRRMFVRARMPLLVLPSLRGLAAQILITALAYATHTLPAAAQTMPRLSAGDIDTIALRTTGTRIAYGADSLQFGDLRIPSGRGPFPVAIVIHGGCYLSRYATLRNTAALADALTAAGIATWNVEYRRYDHPGGGWPNTFLDVAGSADYVRALAKRFPLDLSRVITTGHSAGGQLALWLASRSQIPKGGALHSAKPIRISGVVALGPITDMREFYGRERRSCGNPAIESVLGNVPDSVPDRVALVSPIERASLGVPIVLIAGALDGIAPAASLEAYAAAARTKRDSVVLIISPGESHFDAIAPFRVAGQAAIDAAKHLVAAKKRAPAR